MNDNFELVMEVSVLEEKGYHLAPDQRRLTTIQKLFLGLSNPIYHKEVRRRQKELQEHPEKTEENEEDKKAWKKQYKQRVIEKREWMRLQHG